MSTSSQSALQPSGRMENGVAVAYDFSISEVIKEGWSKVYGVKATYWGALACYVLIACLMGAIIYFLGEALGGAANPISNAVSALLRLVAQIILYPLYAGILMIGIKRAVNLPVRAGLVFRYYNAMWRILGVMLLSLFITMLPTVIGGIILGIVMNTDLSLILSLLLGLVGFIFILAGIYFAWCYIFVIQLTTEKRLSVWRALETSRKAVTQHWWKLFLTTLLLALIYLLSAIPLLIGLIWTLPLTINTQGVLYRRIFGVESDLASNG